MANQQKDFDLCKTKECKPQSQPCPAPQGEGQSAPWLDAFAAHTKWLCRKAFHSQTVW